MKQILFLCCSFIFYAASIAQKIQYIVSFPNAVHHEVHIELKVSEVPINKTAIFKMSRSSPGRYATHEFGKNVYDVMAKDMNGK